MGGRGRERPCPHLRSLVRRHWVACFGLIALLTFFAGIPVLGALEKASKDAFSVMTYNIWDLSGKGPAVQDVAKVIRSAGIPDILLLQDVGSEEMAVSLSTALALPYRFYLRVDGHGYDLAILARYPLTDSGFFCFKSSQTGAGCFKGHGNDQWPKGAGVFRTPGPNSFY